jgi:flagellar biogenesis protein FliO
MRGLGLATACFLLAVVLCDSAKAVDTAAPSPASANVNSAIRAADSADKGYSGPFENKPIHHNSQTAATNPSSSSSNYTASDLARVPLALGAVILLILCLRWIIRSLGGYQTGKSGNRAVQVLTRTTISPRQQMLVLQFGRRLLLVGSSGSELKPLCQIDDADEVAEVLAQIQQHRSGVVTRSFGAMFGRAEKAYQGAEPSSPGADEELPPQSQPEPNVTADRGEALVGLMDRVRRMSEQFQQS